jgi:hypothetical protein
MLQVPLVCLNAILSQEEFAALAAADGPRLATFLAAGFRALTTTADEETTTREPTILKAVAAPEPSAPGPTSLGSASRAVAPASSYSLGVCGEQLVERVLAAHYQVERTADQAASGDLRLRHNGLCLMVEVKNYSRPVPQTEVDKLERDMEVHPEAAGALAVSLRAGFVGLPAFQMRNTSDGRPLALLHSSHPELIRAVVQVLFAEAEHRRRRASCALEELGYARICLCVEEIGELVAQQGRLRYQLAQLRSTVNRQCDSLSEGLLLTETRVRERVEGLLGLLSLHVAPNAGSEVPRRGMVRELRGLVLAFPLAHRSHRKAVSDGGEDEDREDNTSSRAPFSQREFCRGAITQILLTLRGCAREGGKKVFRAQTTHYLQVQVGGLRVRFQPLQTKLDVHVPLPEGLAAGPPVPLFARYEHRVVTVSLSREFVARHLDPFCEFVRALAQVVGDGEAGGD